MAMVQMVLLEDGFAGGSRVISQLLTSHTPPNMRIYVMTESCSLVAKIY